MAAGGRLTGAAAPLVLTLQMDDESFRCLDALRRRHYPAERNLVPAHVTLFHALPGERVREIGALLARAAASERRIEADVAGVRALEHGAAVFLRSPRLSALRDGLAAEWEPWLADRDRVGFQPHATIAAASGEGEARRLAREVASELRLRRIVGTGLHLWRYRDGPWEDLRLFRFRG